MLSNLFGSKRAQQFEIEKNEWIAETRSALLEELRSDREAFEKCKEKWIAETRAALKAELQSERDAHLEQVAAERAEFEAYKVTWKAEVMKQLEAEKLAFATHQTQMSEAMEQRACEEKERLRSEWAQLESEKLKFATIQSTLHACTVAEDEVVRLNVGGKLFACKASLLQKIPNTPLSAIVSDKWRTGAAKVEGCIFIDRDPEVFPIIMTFLRTHGTSFDWEAYRATWTEREVQLVKMEAEFYMLRQCMLEPIGNMLQTTHWSSIMGTTYKDRRLICACSATDFTLEHVAARIPAECRNMLLVLKQEEGRLIGCVTPRLRFDGKTEIPFTYGSYIFAIEPASAVINKVSVARKTHYYHYAQVRKHHYFCIAQGFLDNDGEPTQVSLTINLTTKNISWFVTDQHKSTTCRNSFEALEIWSLK